MKTIVQTKKKNRKGEPYSIYSAILPADLTLMQFRELECEHFDEDEFLAILKNCGLIDHNGNLSKRTIEMNWLYLKDAKPSHADLFWETISQGRVIMVGDYGFLSRLFEVIALLNNKNSTLLKAQPDRLLES